MLASTAGGGTKRVATLQRQKKNEPENPKDTREVPEDGSGRFIKYK